MDESGRASLIHDDLGRHASQFKEIHLLAVELEHVVIWIGQTHKRQVVQLEITGKGPCLLGSNDKNNRITLDEFHMILAQLRHVSLAERSGKTAVENKQDILAAAVV